MSGVGGSWSAQSTGQDDDILVLHVDDDVAMADLTATYLERIDDDIDIISETTPEAGLEQLSAEPVDCVVSDYQMPEMDGIEFLEAVRDRFPNLPFILFTGKGSEDVATDAINAGVTFYLQKGGSESYELLANRIQNGVSQRRSERRATVARDRLLNLYEQTDGFFIVDGDWTITYWNQVMEARTGEPAVDVLGTHFWDVFSEAEGTGLGEHYREAMETRTATEFETFYEPNGYWIEVRCYPVEEGLFIHSRDITTEREQAAEIERRNHILQSFASTVSHDLRNPLNVAEGKLELAQETGDFEHLEDVARAHNRMRNLIDELLRIARDEDVELMELTLDEVATDGWATVSAESMDLVVEDDAVFTALNSQLRRLFENLFWNAIEHGDADTVRVGRLDDGFYVEDDGVGIPPEDRSQVLDSGFSTDNGNPGYGLHIVVGITEVHDWELQVTEGDDGGARFEIRGVTFVDA